MLIGEGVKGWDEVGDVENCGVNGYPAETPSFMRRIGPGIKVEPLT